MDQEPHGKILQSAEKRLKRLEDSPLKVRVLSQDDAEQLYAIYPDLPHSHNEGCPSCGKNLGAMVDGEVEIGGEVWQCNCHDQLQRHKHYLDSGIGLTYQLLDWSDFHGDQNALGSVADYLHDLSSNVESGKGFMLGGTGYGTGKTMLAALALKSCVWHGYRCYMTTFADMLSSMKAGWKDAQYAKWYKNKVDSAQVLLVDDLGKELMPGAGFNNDFAKQVFDSMLRTRTQQGRPTFITTNLNPQQLMSTYGPAVWSLLNERFDVISVGGEDYRGLAERKMKGRRRIY